MRRSPPPAVLIPGAQVMGYTVERQLGQGGFGTVYLARCEGQPCALKLLHVPRVGGRVEREVSILLRLDHPNVVGILGHGVWPVVEPAFAVILMEYVDGRRLDVWAEEENPSARQVAQVVLDVARALAASHEAGVLHRDVKESNVMVRSADGLAKLVDFGIGNYEGAPGLTPDILPPGTPEYRSPEAWAFFLRNRGVPGARYVPGPPDDLWALGIVLYVLLTARFPFEGMTEPDLWDAVVAEAPTPPHEVNARVPRALSELCMWLLEKTPTRRAPSAREFGKALEDVLRDADAAWDVPLCDFHGVDTATTEGDRPSLDKWVIQPQHGPRRGKRPLPEAPPLSSRDSPSEGATEPVSKPWGASRVGSVLALAVMVVALAALLLRWSARVPGSGPPRQEVATSGKSPQADRAVAPTGPEVRSAAVAFPATLQEVPATVTTQTKNIPLQPTPKPIKKSLGAMARTVGTVAACASFACPSAQVRPGPPPPERCPTGAVQVMEKLGIELREKQPVVFIKGRPRYISVRSGLVEVHLIGNMDGLPDNTVLSGQLFVSDRVYGRITWAKTPAGDSFPVCFEIYNGSGDPGMDREEGDDSASSARIFTTGQVRAVPEFK
ncbi:serine/threonine-protein kinase [Corallococcus sp. bb12-1]|uniref:serine/threonine protein kinase n=1 Tax=Corallococcus sp. bb12-1 TaxID=2996784 RepID=UPI002271A056|nr:serine/threonine-protein kinase [Corallococcus sp. bb12-1]MCY1045082.1 serine/threonine-protein kinase [Corallococcus sp. bb12-1]